MVEDDREINDLVANYLRAADLSVIQLFDGREIERTIVSPPVDLIILDVNLPGEDGFAVCLRLRRQSAIPIIILTARAEDVDRILGLEIGADDYITKPFNPRELLARVCAVLRRHDGGVEPAVRTFGFEGWQIDLVARRLRNPAGSDVALTTSEYELLLIFCEHAGQVLARERILRLMHGSPATGRSIDIVVSRLRRKIESDTRDPRLIRTVRAGGYVFASSIDRTC